MVREGPDRRSGARVRLGDRARAAMRVRHLSRHAQEAYLHWMRRNHEFHGRRDPATLGSEQVPAFLSSLATESRVAASTRNQALAALLFLYRHVLGIDLPRLDDLVRARRPQRLPTVLSREEVARVFTHLEGVPRPVSMLLHGAGLRLLEAARLRVKDLDLASSQILVREPKGGCDRATVLPALARAYLLKESLLEELGCAAPDPHHALRRWIAWACRSRLAPFVKLGRTIRNHLPGVIALLRERLSNGLAEGFNNTIRLLSHRAYGFHGSSPLIATIYLCCGGIRLPNLQLV